MSQELLTLPMLGWCYIWQQPDVDVVEVLWRCCHERVKDGKGARRSLSVTQIRLFLTRSTPWSSSQGNCFWHCTGVSPRELVLPFPESGGFRRCNAFPGHLFG